MPVNTKPGPKRRLPVLNSPAAEEPANRRPWQWVGFGAFATFTLWIPFSALAGWAGMRLSANVDPGDHARLVRTAVAVAVLHLLALALGASLGGFLVGRWGTHGVGVWQAALSGLSAAAVALGVTWASFGFSANSLLLAVVAPPIAALGAKIGLRRRVP